MKKKKHDNYIENLLREAQRKSIIETMRREGAITIGQLVNHLNSNGAYADIILDISMSEILGFTRVSSRTDSLDDYDNLIISVLKDSGQELTFRTIHLYVGGSSLKLQKRLKRLRRDRIISMIGKTRGARYSIRN